MAEDVLRHTLGLDTMAVPDTLDVALGTIGAGFGFTELTRSGYSRQNTDGDWAAETVVLPAEDYSYARNTAGITFGPAGENWPSGEKVNLVIMDSGGTPWWQIHQHIAQVDNTFNLIMEASTCFVRSLE